MDFNKDGPLMMTLIVIVIILTTIMALLPKKDKKDTQHTDPEIMEHGELPPDIHKQKKSRNYTTSTRRNLTRRRIFTYFSFKGRRNTHRTTMRGK